MLITSALAYEHRVVETGDNTLTRTFGHKWKVRAWICAPQPTRITEKLASGGPSEAHSGPSHPPGLRTTRYPRSSTSGLWRWCFGPVTHAVSLRDAWQSKWFSVSPIHAPQLHTELSSADTHYPACDLSLCNLAGTQLSISPEGCLLCLTEEKGKGTRCPAGCSLPGRCCHPISPPGKCSPGQQTAPDFPCFLSAHN